MNTQTTAADLEAAGFAVSMRQFVGAHSVLVRVAITRGGRTGAGCAATEATAVARAMASFNER